MKTCSHVNRVSVHPSIRIGGTTIGRCSRPCLPRMTVCYEHATREALAYLIRSLHSELEEVSKRRLSNPVPVPSLNWPSFGI